MKRGGKKNHEFESFCSIEDEKNCEISYGMEFVSDFQVEKGKIMLFTL